MPGNAEKDKLPKETALEANELPEENNSTTISDVKLASDTHTMATHIGLNRGTVLPAKSDSDVMFCLQSNQGLIIDRSLVY